ncbi:M23 family metallopeptidase [uncultured Rothia sp.]|uniref:M23 family metallopeptidase n=1 Tax=uncultured Rothia sp. TaxID=316088 RepID=UPI003217AD37
MNLSFSLIYRASLGRWLLAIVLPPLLLFAFATDGRAAPTAYPRWQWPTHTGAAVLQEFEKPAKKWSPGHRGVDLAADDAAVRSPANGKVVFSGKVVDRTVITVEHANGLRSSFEPVRESLKVGTEVKAGEHIAEIDTAIVHCPTLCVHWGVREGKGDTAEYLNPMLFLGKEDPSVLLPIGEDFAA